MAGKWGETELGDVVSVTHGWPFKSELYSNESLGGPIVVSVGNFRYTGGFRFSETAVKEYRGEYPKEYELSAGDILLVMTCQTAGGEILGLPARVPDDGHTYLHNQRLGKIVVKRPDVTDADFLYWLFHWAQFNRELYLSASGTKILHTAPSRIEQFRFALPSLSEQRAIAHMLGTLDDKIELNRRMNKTLEGIARALFKSWFVDFDPVRAKADGRGTGLPPHIAGLFPDRMEPSELGEIPAGWEVRPLDEVANFLNGLALQNYPAENGDSLPVIKIAQLRRRSSEGADRCSRNLPKDYIIVDGDVLFSWSGSLFCELWTGGRGALNQHLFKVTSDSVPKWFYYLSTLQHLPEFRQIAAGKATTMGHIQRHHLTEALTVVPDEPMMGAADEIFAPLIERTVQATVEARALAALRNTLLPKLISGEVRLNPGEVAK